MKRAPILSALLILLTACTIIGCDSISSFAGGGEPDESRIDIEDRFVHFGIYIRNYGDTVFQWSRLASVTCRTDGQHWKLSNLLDTARPHFSEYDTSVVRFTDSLIIPLREGWTPLRVTYPTYSDPIGLVVRRIEENLVVDFDRRSLRNARYYYQYENSIRDTTDGARRIAALDSITPGMSLSYARILLNGVRHFYSRRYPSALFAIVDHDRGV